MPLYHTVCEGCGRQEDDFLAAIGDVQDYDDHLHGFPCESCGRRAIIQLDVASRVHLPNDNRLPADVTGERLTPSEFTAKYGKDSVPLEPGTALAKQKREAMRARSEDRARAAGYSGVGHMLREVKRKSANGVQGGSR